MSEKRFNCVLGKDYHIINDNFDNMTYFLQERNDVVKLMDLLNEQQATIRRLQDLCGESDGENAKLRIENKKLKEERQRLIYHLNKEPKR